VLEQTAVARNDEDDFMCGRVTCAESAQLAIGRFTRALSWKFLPPRLNQSRSIWIPPDGKVTNDKTSN
jgi:hypothetical protein